MKKHLIEPHSNSDSWQVFKLLVSYQQSYCKLELYNIVSALSTLLLSYRDSWYVRSHVRQTLQTLHYTFSLSLCVILLAANINILLVFIYLKLLCPTGKLCPKDRKCALNLYWSINNTAYILFYGNTMLTEY